MFWYNSSTRSRVLNLTTILHTHEVKTVHTLQNRRCYFAPACRQQHRSRRHLHSSRETRAELSTSNQFIEDYKKSCTCMTWHTFALPAKVALLAQHWRLYSWFSASYYFSQDHLQTGHWQDCCNPWLPGHSFRHFQIHIFRPFAW